MERTQRTSQKREKVTSGVKIVTNLGPARVILQSVGAHLSSSGQFQTVWTRESSTPANTLTTWFLRWRQQMEACWNPENEFCHGSSVLYFILEKTKVDMREQSICVMLICEIMFISSLETGLFSNQSCTPKILAFASEMIITLRTIQSGSLERTQWNSSTR